MSTPPSIPGSVAAHLLEPIIQLLPLCQHLRPCPALPTPVASTSYTYDSGSRLSVVGDGTYSASYGYLANSSLVGQIVMKNGTTTLLTTTRGFDSLNRLSTTTSAPTGAGALSFGYRYNGANQRTRMNLADGSYWIYDYDALGQVRSGKRFWVDHTPVPGQQFEYGFDDIGNRTSSKNGGDSSGAGLRTSAYSVNLLNQYTQRTVPGGIDVIGLANAGQSVSVNGSSADYRRGEYFQESVTVSNGASAVWQGVSVTTSGGGSASGNVFVAKTPELMAYDLDGNTVSDGRWDYYWDAENRLVSLVTKAALGQPLRLDFEYDTQGRRIRKRVWNNTAGTGSPTLDRRYVYDGWNVLVELDGTNGLVQSYVWGLDLSGSLQGAGGVGGLVAVRPAGSPARFTAFDGNGNVMALVNGATGQVDAHYEYGPFGEVLRASGSVSKANPFRFSTKYQDDETEFLYYGYRYYDARNGRWLNRDPIEEKGGINIYYAANNDLVNAVDILGLSTPECINLLADLARKAALLNKELAKYDPFKDGQGGFPMKYGTGLTKPGGHFNEMMDLKKGLYRDLMEYYKRCVCKGCGDPPPPKKYEDLINQHIPLPVYPKSWLVDVPGSNGLWTTVAVSSQVVSGVAAVTVGVITMPEFTIPIILKCYAH